MEVNKQYTRHTTGIASNLYYHRFTLYDENNNELCQKTIHTPYSKQEVKVENKDMNFVHDKNRQ